MKFKVPQLVGGISAVLWLIANFLFIVNWFVQDYGNPGWDLYFWRWPISLLIEAVAILAFTILYKNKLLRYLAIGLYIASRMIYSLVGIYLDGFSVTGALRDFFFFYSWEEFNLEAIVLILEFLTILVFIVAAILSLIESMFASAKSSSSVNIAGVSTSYNSPRNSSKAPSRYSDIEGLGDLLAKGLITQEEFDLKKRQILGLD
jgi:hypothetical protein